MTWKLFRKRCKPKDDESAKQALRDKMKSEYDNYLKHRAEYAKDHPDAYDQGHDDVILWYGAP
jgi:hypothetical protein